MRSVEECYRGRDVRVFRVDVDGVLERLRTKARTLVDTRPDVVEVRLFGSLARGEARPGSDADLFVLLLDGAPPFLERIPALARSFASAGIGCEVLAWTESELAAATARGGRFARTVLDEGVVLARRRTEVVTYT